MACYLSVYNCKQQADTSIWVLALNWLWMSTCSTSGQWEEAGDSSCRTHKPSTGCYPTTDAGVTMVTHENWSLLRGTSRKSAIKRDVNTAEAGEPNGIVEDMTGKTPHCAIIAASEQCEWKRKGKTLRSKISESVSAPGDRQSQMDRTMRSQACNVAQL